MKVVNNKKNKKLKQIRNFTISTDFAYPLDNGKQILIE